jgi:hypothetical protein
VSPRPFPFGHEPRAVEPAPAEPIAPASLRTEPVPALCTVPLIDFVRPARVLPFLTAAPPPAVDAPQRKEVAGKRSSLRSRALRVGLVLAAALLYVALLWAIFTWGP